jgi:two-component system, cell cycle response regulator DivK
VLPSPLSITPVADSPLALLVDRDDDTRAMYAEYLRFARYEIEEAGDGREGLAKALARRPQVVVTETRLPGIDGFQLCRLLRDDVFTRAIPIVVVTADAYVPNLERAREAGASEVLIKPCLPDVLLAEIRRLVDVSVGLRERSVAARDKAGHEIARAADAVARSTSHRRLTLARSHHRGQTLTPPIAPPQLVCPLCDMSLTYDFSHIGGVSARHSEQWDYYTCPASCGTFQYRQRTRKLRKV